MVEGTPPQGRPSATPTGSNAGPQGRTLWGRLLGPHTRTDRTRDTRVAEPQLPAPEDGRPGEGQRLTPDAPHNGGRPPPPGDGPPPPPRHAAPTGHAGQGDRDRPPHPHARARSTWVADPNSPPSGRAVGGGGAPDLRRPSQWWKAPPPRDALPPFPQGATPARKGARCGDGAGSPRPHRRHPGHMGRGTPAARPRGRAAGGGTAPDTRRPSQRWKATQPGTAPHHPRGTQPPQGMQAKGTVMGPHTHTSAPAARGWQTPTARPVGGQSREGERLTSDAPHNGGRHPPLGTPFRHPHSEQRRPARAHAVDSVLGPHAGTDRTRDTRVAEPRPPAPEDGRSGDGQRLTPDAPRNGGRPAPPGDRPPPPPRHAAPRGRAGQGNSVRPPHPHARAHSLWLTDPNSPPSGWAVGGGKAPDLRRPSQWRKAPPPGTPFRQPHSEQRRPARAHAVEPGLGPHARTDRIRNTRVAVPRLPAPEDGRSGEGQRLTPDAPNNSGRPPPLGDGPPPPPRHAAPTGRARQAR